MKGRKGININVGLELFKTLVRPHLEYAIPAWAGTGSKQLDILEESKCSVYGR